MYFIKVEKSKIVKEEKWINTEPKTNSFNGDIQFDHVNFSYPTRPNVPVLHNFTLTAHAGKTTALVGSNGSGEFSHMYIF